MTPLSDLKYMLDTSNTNVNFNANTTNDTFDPNNDDINISSPAPTKSDVMVKSTREDARKLRHRDSAEPAVKPSRVTRSTIIEATKRGRGRPLKKCKKAVLRSSPPPSSPPSLKRAGGAADEATDEGAGGDGGGVNAGEPTNDQANGQVKKKRVMKHTATRTPPGARNARKTCTPLPKPPACKRSSKFRKGTRLTKDGRVDARAAMWAFYKSKEDEVKHLAFGDKRRELAKMWRVSSQSPRNI